MDRRHTPQVLSLKRYAKIKDRDRFRRGGA